MILKGALSRKEFWAVDLRSGVERALTDLGPGQVIGDFDVAADGRRIVFDRAREESDIALIELADETNFLRTPDRVRRWIWALESLKARRAVSLNEQTRTGRERSRL